MSIKKDDDQQAIDFYSRDQKRREALSIAVAHKHEDLEKFKLGNQYFFPCPIMRAAYMEEVIKARKGK